MLSCMLPTLRPQCYSRGEDPAWKIQAESFSVPCCKFQGLGEPLAFVSEPREREVTCTQVICPGLGFTVSLHRLPHRIVVLLL